MSERSQLISKLKNNKNYRATYIKAKLNVLIPSQIRALRLKYLGTQKALGKAAEMKQSRISVMERPGAAHFNIETLVNLAAAFKVGLVVKFVPFSEMLGWENRFSQDAFDVTILPNDIAFLEPERVMERVDIQYSVNDGTMGQRKPPHVEAAIGGAGAFHALDGWTTTISAGEPGARFRFGFADRIQ